MSNPSRHDTYNTAHCTQSKLYVPSIDLFSQCWDVCLSVVCGICARIMDLNPCAKINKYVMKKKEKKKTLKQVTFEKQQKQQHGNKQINKQTSNTPQKRRKKEKEKKKSVLRLASTISVSRSCQPVSVRNLYSSWESPFWSRGKADTKIARAAVPRQ